MKFVVEASAPSAVDHPIKTAKCDKVTLMNRSRTMSRHAKRYSDNFVSVLHVGSGLGLISMLTRVFVFSFVGLLLIILPNDGSSKLVSAILILLFWAILERLFR